MPNLRELSICSFKLHTVDSVERVFVLERWWDHNNLWSFNGSPDFIPNNMITWRSTVFPKTILIRTRKRMHLLAQRNLFSTWWWHKQKISYSTSENNSTKSTFNILILDKMKIIQVEMKACTVDLANKVHSLIDHDRKEQDLKIQTS